MSTSAESTQTQNAPLPVKGQPTPVIIKFGEGGDGAPEQNKVTINGAGKAFESSLDDGRWIAATSTATANIFSLSVQDGLNNLGIFESNFIGELTTLLVISGRDMLAVSDVALEDSTFTKVVINSPVSFTVTEPGNTSGQWIESDAVFPSDKPFILFSQGGRVLAKLQCETNDVTLTLTVDWDETG
jgi:hypothetical protein